MRWLGLVLLAGCVDSEPEGIEPADDGLRPLASRSDGACPDLSSPGTSTFSSGGIERKVNVQWPEGGSDGLPVVFSFHGLMSPSQNPVRYMVRGFGLKQLAEDRRAIIVTPEAQTTSMPGIGEVSLWGILGDSEADLTLFDDLRSCVVDELGGDPRRLSVWGHSGGALWTSVLLSERGDALAAVAEFSGGSDFDMPLVGDGLVPYATPPQPVPALLFSGGDTDVWPDPTFTLLDFEQTSDNLEAALVDDGMDVIRCKHQLGHVNFPDGGFETAIDFVLDHDFNQPSPWAQAEMPLDICSPGGLGL